MSDPDYRQLVIEWAQAVSRIERKLKLANKKVTELEQQKETAVMDVVQASLQLEKAQKHLNLFLDLLEGKEWTKSPNSWKH